MRVEFSAPDDEEKTSVASAGWDGHEVTVTADDDERRDALVRAFRRTPVVTNDASLRRRLNLQGGERRRANVHFVSVRHGKPAASAPG